jgi:hypothetical protein
VAPISPRRLSLLAERYDILPQAFWLALLRPGPHQLAALVEDVRTAVDPLNLAADLMPYGLLDHSAGTSRGLLIPGPQRRPEAVCGDRPAAGRFKPLLLADVRPFRRTQQGHVGQGLVPRLQVAPGEDVPRDLPPAHLLHDLDDAVDQWSSLLGEGGSGRAPGAVAEELEVARGRHLAHG